jgi:hypothetical protein
VFSAHENGLPLGERVCSDGVDIVKRIGCLLNIVTDIHLARHVDLDAIRQVPGTTNEDYLSIVANARSLVRDFEAAVQAIYDDGSTLLMAIQGVRRLEFVQFTQDRESVCERLIALSVSMKVRLHTVKQRLEALLSLGHDQARVSLGDYNRSISWRTSHVSSIENGAWPTFNNEPYPNDVGPTGYISTTSFDLHSEPRGSIEQRTSSDLSHDTTLSRSREALPISHSDTCKLILVSCSEPTCYNQESQRCPSRLQGPPWKM